MDKGSSWHRFWGEPAKRNVYYSRNRSRVRFDIEPHIKTEHFGGDPAPNANRAASEYADFLTNHYELLEVKYPVFYELRQLFIIDSLVLWLQDQRYAIDAAWLEYKPAQVKTPRKIPAVTVIRRGIKNDERIIMGVYGGMSFTNRNRYRSDKSGLRNLIKHAMQNKPEDAAISWTFDENGEQYRAVSLTVENPVLLPKRKRLVIGKPEIVPVIKWIWVPNRSGQGKVTFTNNSDRFLTISINGTSESLGLGRGASGTLTLTPGDYSYTVSTPGIRALNGSVSITNGGHKSVGLKIETTTHFY